MVLILVRDNGHSTFPRCMKLSTLGKTLIVLFLVSRKRLRTSKNVISNLYIHDFANNGEHKS